MVNESFRVIPMKPFLLIVFFAASSVFGQFLPPDRVMDWNRSVIGVPGGIPNRTTIFCNAAVSIPGTNLVMVSDALAGTPTDNTLALQVAINLCPSNQVVYIPAGNYACSNQINCYKSGITIRGDGSNTILYARMLNPSWSFLNIGSYLTQLPIFSVLSGTTKGSTNLSVASLPDYVLPNLSTIILSQSNDYAYVHSLIYTTNVVPNPSTTNLMKLSAWVTATTSTNITFWPPLPFDLTNGPVTAVGYYGRTVMFDGVENLKILADSSNNVPTLNLYLYHGFGCWIKNIESAYTAQSHIYVNNSYVCEIRDNYVHDFYGAGGGNNGEGIELYSNCRGFLIENNIASHVFPGVNTSGNSSGNVIAYNYGYASHSGSTVIGNDFDANHAPHNVMNLWEGNVGTMFQSDGYYGSASHITVFRNYFSGMHPEGLTYHRLCIDLTHWSDYFNVAGNVLGVPGWQTPTNGGNAGIYSTTNSNYSYLTPAIYRFGFPSMGNNNYTSASTNPASADLNDLDYQVEPSTLLLANFDYYHNAVVNPTNSLPASLFYTNTPSWWNDYGTTPWPPIGSDLTPMVSSIPAQLRYAGGTPSLPAPPATSVFHNTTIGTLRISPP